VWDLLTVMAFASFLRRVMLIDDDDDDDDDDYDDNVLKFRETEM
jgi:hypothetical protein